ncbi:hypothetical protein [Fulvivirga sp.]
MSKDKDKKKEEKSLKIKGSLEDVLRASTKKSDKKGEKDKLKGEN